MNTSHLTTVIPLCSAVFFAGYQVNRIDELFTMVHAAEAENKGTKDVLMDIHGRVCSIEKDIKHINNKLDK